MMTSLFILSKKIHRLLVIPILLASLLVGGTGILLKEQFADFNLIDRGLVRYLHNELSTYLVITLFLMSLTGIFLYIIPSLRLKQINDKRKVN